MLKIITSAKEYLFSFNGKLSASSVKDILNLTVNGTEYLLTKDDLTFKSTDILSEFPTIFLGNFSLVDGTVFSVDDSVKIQNLYADWEGRTLNRNTVSYKVPQDRSDQSAGVPAYNPLFLAMVNKVCRDKGFDLNSFGSFTTKRENLFIQQYTAFHPSIQGFVAKKYLDNNKGFRAQITCKMFEQLVANACSHIEGYRDSLRHKKFAEINGIKPDFEEIKFLIEYDHVLDANISDESINFQDGSSDGGMLELFNLPVY